MFANPSIVLGAIVGSLTLSVLASPVAENGHAKAARGQITLGGVDINNACVIQQGDGWYSTTNGGSDCDDWLCTNGASLLGVNMNVACVSQYVQPNAYAGCSGGLYNWECYLDS
ncbi:hypothetical protein F5Y16DRAFT_400868 [Xylariaceae sp. FL0255]|nr:hypothetical protein F5Y16DRAFT_400868 [Xylariaceae sp. FL0255]